MVDCIKIDYKDKRYPQKLLKIKKYPQELYVVRKCKIA